MNPFSEYRITSPYGWRIHPISQTREFHTGIDLVKAHQSPIYAFVGGEVIHAKEGVTGSGFGGYGVTVAVLDHSTGHLHCYAHLDMAVVKVGQMVERGQMIGRQGNTGKSTGSHLHYEIRKFHTPSFGWIADRENNCFEPTAYLQKYYERRNTVVTKERIRLVKGKLEYIPLNSGNPYSVKATDVRLLRFDKNKVRFKFVAEKGGKVSSLVKKHGADYGINFPHFYQQIPTGYVWADGKYINGAYGEVKEWYGLGIKGSSGVIGQLTDAQIRQQDIYVQGKPPLILDGKIVAKNDGQACQRTFVGIDDNGDWLIAIADGRTSSDVGLTCEEMALYMKDKGAVWALNGDGGGSTILADQTGGLNQSLNTGVNERVVHHALLIYLDKDNQGYKDSDVITYGDLKKLGLIK